MQFLFCLCVLPALAAGLCAMMILFRTGYALRLFSMTSPREARDLRITVELWKRSLNDK